MTLTEIKLRPAKESDFPAIKSLIKEGQINPMGLDWQRFLVAVSPKNEVIACGQIKPHRDGTQELASLAVTKKSRGQGIAKLMIETLIAEFQGKLYLMCQSSLGALYEKFHFVKITENEMPKYFRRVSKLVSFVEPLRKRGETLLIMMREFEIGEKSDKN